MKCCFLHLSDIHFSKNSGEQYDLDDDLRNELLYDVEECLANFEKITGILISGDIAFSGRAGEYEIASKWLTKLRSYPKLKDVPVLCVPGNHDVDRNVVARPPIEDMHKALQSCNEIDIDDVLKRYVSFGGGEMYYNGLEAYNTFAEQFGCKISSSSPYWEKKFSLGFGYDIVIRGGNSTIASNAGDSKGSMIFGEHQVPQRVKNSIYVLLCHHPHDWWKDRDEVKRKLRSRVAVSLYGHKHTQNYDLYSSHLQISSGAVHPNRREPHWLPRYHWVEFEILEQDELSLHVCAYPRKWDQSEFKPDFDACEGKHSKQWKICSLEHIKTGKFSEKCVVDENCRDAAAKVSGTSEQRNLLNLFFTLSSVERCQVMTELGYPLSLAEVADRGNVLKLFHKIRTDEVEQLFWDVLTQKKKGA